LGSIQNTSHSRFGRIKDLLNQMFFFKLLSILAHELGAFENLLISIVLIIDRKFTDDPSGNRFREDFKERLDGFFDAAESQCKRNGLGETRELIGNFLKVLGDMEIDVALKADLRTPALLVLAGNIGCDLGFSSEYPYALT
jgi:hypothetical protein